MIHTLTAQTICSILAVTTIPIRESYKCVTSLHGPFTSSYAPQANGIPSRARKHIPYNPTDDRSLSRAVLVELPEYTESSLRTCCARFSNKPGHGKVKISICILVPAPNCIKRVVSLGKFACASGSELRARSTSPHSKDAIHTHETNSPLKSGSQQKDKQDIGSSQLAH